ncbi:MAG: CNP1-like family protein [Burkholderiales bacterium]
MAKRYFILLLALLCTGPALAGWGDFEYNFDDDSKPWREIQAQLPAYPDLKTALPFFVSAATDNKFFIDPKSISVGEDGIVRYTLIVQSPSGVLNVSFEGIRCATHEKKLYAFGREDNTWSRNRYAKWTPIKYEDLNRQHHVLYDDFFCPDALIVKDANEAISALKRGLHSYAK